MLNTGSYNRAFQMLKMVVGWLLAWPYLPEEHGATSPSVA
jgi:hypothetical protein